MSNETTVLMFLFAGAALAVLVTVVRLGGARRRRAQATLRRIEAETADYLRTKGERRLQEAEGYHTSPTGELYMGLGAALRETYGTPLYKATLDGWVPINEPGPWLVRAAAAARGRMHYEFSEEEKERRAADMRNTDSGGNDIYALALYQMAMNAATAPNASDREVGKSPALGMGYGSNFSTGGGFGADTSFSTGSDSGASCSSDSGSGSCSSD